MYKLVYKHQQMRTNFTYKYICIYIYIYLSSRSIFHGSKTERVLTSWVNTRSHNLNSHQPYECHLYVLIGIGIQVPRYLSILVFEQ